MGHIQEMTDEQRLRFFSQGYELRKHNMRGHNYQYFNEEKHGHLDFWVFKNGDEATKSEILAKKVVEELRKEGFYARIICGYQKDIQRNKYFSIIYRKK